MCRLLEIEYADIEYEPDDTDSEPYQGDWHDQAPPLLSATSFAATYLVRNFENDVSMACYVGESLHQGVVEPCETPEQQYTAVVYLPPAATWILIAGEKLHQLCKGDDRARRMKLQFSLEKWALWRRRFGEIAAAGLLDGRLLDFASRAADEMARIDSS